MNFESTMPAESFIPSRRGGAIAAIDQLIRDALAYNTPEQLNALFAFSRRLPFYSPFNCMLLHIQCPTATWVAPLEKWRALGCVLKRSARPLLILAPMHPVMFVFDVADIEEHSLTPAVRKMVENPFAAIGHVPDLAWKRTLRQSERAGIKLKFIEMATHQAGEIRRLGERRFELLLKSADTRTVQFTTLIHELGHLFCGHLGSITRTAWPQDRFSRTKASEEMEAEAVALLVAQRFGIDPASAKYLSDYLKPGATLPHFSMDAILVAAGAVWEMTQGRLPSQLRIGMPRKRPFKPQTKKQSTTPKA